mmetsp:Transcript_30762/g.34449  ORF Transcript_30762/g.34449 Transcript_30762/m.34449 type:complete len:127 (-) Transcript_30762:69-449(-)
MLIVLLSLSLSVVAVVSSSSLWLDSLHWGDSTWMMMMMMMIGTQTVLLLLLLGHHVFLNYRIISFKSNHIIHKGMARHSTAQGRYYGKRERDILCSRVESRRTERERERGHGGIDTIQFDSIQFNN